MSQWIKSRLVTIVRDWTRSGQGAFQNRIAKSGVSPSTMSNNDLCRELRMAYGADVLDFLDQVDLGKLYEVDVIATLGATRAAAVLAHRRAQPARQTTKKRPVRPFRLPRQVVTWGGGIMGVLAIAVLGHFADGGDESAASTPSASKVVAATAASDADYEPYEFSSCAQYLGAASGLRCFRQVGGDRIPAESSDAQVARREMAQSIRASRWRRHGQCNLFHSQVDGEAFHAGAMAFTDLRDSGRLTQERVYNACSQAANRAAFEACAAASGTCETAY